MALNLSGLREGGQTALYSREIGTVSGQEADSVLGEESSPIFWDLVQGCVRTLWTLDAFAFVTLPL